MRTLVILLAFSPIRICSWNNARWDIAEPWQDTWRGRDTGDRAFFVTTINSPTDNQEVVVGQTIELSALVAFVGLQPREIETQWLYGETSLCVDVVDDDSFSRCTLTIPAGILGAHLIRLNASSPWGDESTTTVRVILVEPEDHAGLTEFSLSSPLPSSQWPAGAVVPFLTTLGDPAPIANARVVWEIDGLQVAELTDRTSDSGIASSAAIIAAGPHEAVATVLIEGDIHTISTRFVVAEDADTDTDTDSDTAAPLP